VPCIDKVVDALRYAHQHRTKNSPYVFTNPTMVERHPDNPEKWCFIYRDCERKSNREPLVAVQKGPTWFQK